MDIPFVRVEGEYVDHSEVLVGVALVGGTSGRGVTVTAKWTLAPSGAIDRAFVQPFVVGPRNDVALFGFDDGRQSRLFLVTLSSGEYEEVFVGPQPVFHAAFDLSAGALYYVQVERQELTEAGIWRRDLSDINAEPDQIREAPAENPIEPRATVGRIYLTPDGSTLLNVRGRLDERVYEAIELASGESVASAPQPWSDFGGVNNAFAVGACLCPDGGILVVGLSDVVARQLPGAADVAIAVSIGDEVGIASWKREASTSVVSMVDPRTGRTTTLWRGGRDWQLAAPDTGHGYEVPEGTVLLTRGEVDPMKALSGAIVLNVAIPVETR